MDRKLTELKEQMDRIEKMLEYLFANSKGICYYNGSLPPKPDEYEHRMEDK